MNSKPLTQKELSEIAGKPVYCPEIESYGIVKCETIGTWAGVPFLVGVWHRDGVAVNFEYNIVKRELKCYKINENYHLTAKARKGNHGRINTLSVLWRESTNQKKIILLLEL